MEIDLNQTLQAVQTTRLQSLLARLPSLDTKHTSAPLDKFTLFPKLPLELRRRIIAFAAHEPRKLKQLLLTKSLHPHLGLSCTYPKIPAILHASSELREEGLRYYTLFECKDGYTRKLRSSRRKLDWYVYANFAVDHFTISDYDLELMTSLDKFKFKVAIDILCKVEVLDCDVEPAFTSESRPLVPILKHLQGLKELHLTGSPYLRYGYRLTDLGTDGGFIWRAVQQAIWNKRIFDAFKKQVGADPKSLSHLSGVQLVAKWILDPGGKNLDEDLYPVGDGMEWSNDTFTAAYT